MTLKWFDNYLRPRSFKVVIDNKYSKPCDLEVSIPQGSCAGVSIFNLYCLTLHEIIPPDLSLSGFADDHSVRRIFKAGSNAQEEATIHILQMCMLNIKSWMDAVRLKMNPSKTEFIYFGNKPQLKKCTTEELNVAGDLIVRSQSIKYLGVHMDEHLNYKLHVTKKCQAAMFNYFKICSIRHLLNITTAACLCLSLCVSHLNYCNSALYGLPDVTIHKLQRVQNMFVCLALRGSKCDSITQCLKEIHWLPICQRIAYKILTLTHKCINKSGPQYLQELITLQCQSRTGLRSAQHSSNLLLRPTTKHKTFANRSFSMAAPVLWNALPDNMRSMDLLTFKKALKMHLFRIAFEGVG